MKGADPSVVDGASTVLASLGRLAMGRQHRIDRTRKPEIPLDDPVPELPHGPPWGGAAGRNSRDCSIQRWPGRDWPGHLGERPSLVPGARRELRIVGVTGHGAEKRNNLVQPGNANESVYDPGQRGLRTTKQSGDQI